MTAKLEKPIRREIEIDGVPFTVTIAPDGVKLTRKGFRKGAEVSWRELRGRADGDEELPAPPAVSSS
jgi:hypothetical protein